MATIISTGVVSRIVVDISNPSAPVEVGRLDQAGASLYDAAVVGSYAYAVGLGTGLRVIDVSDPTASVPVW